MNHRVLRRYWKVARCRPTLNIPGRDLERRGWQWRIEAGADIFPVTFIDDEARLRFLYRHQTIFNGTPVARLQVAQVEKAEIRVKIRLVDLRISFERES